MDVSFNLFTSNVWPLDEKDLKTTELNQFKIDMQIMFTEKYFIFSNKSCSIFLLQ